MTTKVVNQQLGDNWVLSALSTLAERPILVYILIYKFF